MYFVLRRGIHTSTDSCARSVGRYPHVYVLLVGILRALFQEWPPLFIPLKCCDKAIRHQAQETSNSVCLRALSEHW